MQEEADGDDEDDADDAEDGGHDDDGDGGDEFDAKKVRNRRTAYYTDRVPCLHILVCLRQRR